MNVICTKNAPAAVGPYSQAIDCSDLVFLYGRPLVPETGLVADGGLEAQAHQMFANIKAVLAEAGMSLSNVVKTTVFMTDLASLPRSTPSMLSISRRPTPRAPAWRSALPKGVLVECELIAKR